MISLGMLKKVHSPHLTANIAARAWASVDIHLDRPLPPTCPSGQSTHYSPTQASPAVPELEGVLCKPSCPPLLKFPLPLKLMSILKFFQPPSLCGIAIVMEEEVEVAAWKNRKNIHREYKWKIWKGKYIEHDLKKKIGNLFIYLRNRCLKIASWPKEI